MFRKPVARLAANGGKTLNVGPIGGRALVGGQSFQEEVDKLGVQLQVAGHDQVTESHDGSENEKILLIKL